LTLPKNLVRVFLLNWSDENYFTAHQLRAFHIIGPASSRLNTQPPPSATNSRKKQTKQELLFGENKFY